MHKPSEGVHVGYNGPMNIVVFDSDAACRDILGAGLQDHAVTFVDGPLTDENARDHAGAEIVSVFISSGFPKERIDLFPNLKCIVTRSTGIDHIDVGYAKQKGIVVANVPRYGAHTVAEFAFALLLSLTRHIFSATLQVREEGSFDTKRFEGFDLYGKTIGVIGTGAIGRNVALIAQGFGMRVLMMDKFPDEKIVTERATYVPMDQLLAESDIVTLHVPYLPENHHLLNTEAFSKMKKGALVINTARGELIDTQALLEALKSGTVAGAGLDVLEDERALKDEMELVRGTESINDLKALIRNHMLIDMPQVIITPHIAFFSKEAYTEILTTSLNDVKNFCVGAPSNVIQV